MRKFLHTILLLVAMVGVLSLGILEAKKGFFPRLYFDGMSVPVLLPESTPLWITDPGAVPLVLIISNWVKLLTYGQYHFAVFNDRGTPKIVAIADYGFFPTKCWKHGLDKDGNFVLEKISELEYLSLLGKYHGKD